MADKCSAHDIRNHVYYDDLNDDMKMMADVIGYDDVMLLMGSHLAGQTIRIQKLSRVGSALDKLTEECLAEGISARYIAQYAGVSDTTIRRRMKKKLKHNNKKRSA